MHVEHQTQVHDGVVVLDRIQEAAPSAHVDPEEDEGGAQHGLKLGSGLAPKRGEQQQEGGQLAEVGHEDLDERQVQAGEPGHRDEGQVPPVVPVHGDIRKKRVGGREAPVQHQALKRHVDPVVVIRVGDLLGVGVEVDGQAGQHQEDEGPRMQPGTPRRGCPGQEDDQRRNKSHPGEGPQDGLGEIGHPVDPVHPQERQGHPQGQDQRCRRQGVTLAQKPAGHQPGQDQGKRQKPGHQEPPTVTRRGRPSRTVRPVRSSWTISSSS